MYYKIVWCFIFILTFLDLSLTSIKTVLGRSDDATTHEAHIEGLPTQEWGGAGLEARPAALQFGRAELGAAHVRVVTLTNRGRAPLHLASVAGTTPHFHASFFDAKTLAPNASTSFRVVFVGREAGAVSAHLYLHTSRGVHKYPVSAVGVASPWDVWPLAGLRVPHNATLEPTISIYNPTLVPLQITEVYSSAAWLRLRLAGGGAAAAWRVPPLRSADLVTLVPAPRAPAVGYVRIRGRALEWLVVVEAAPAPAGVFAHPPQLRVATHAAHPPLRLALAAGNSAPAPAQLQPLLLDHACRPQPAADHLHTANGDSSKSSSGVASLTVHEHLLQPHAPPTLAATLILDPAKALPAAEGAEGAESVVCGGRVRLGGATLPYTLTVRRGGLRLPHNITFITSSEDGEWRDLVAHNDHGDPVILQDVRTSDDFDEHFELLSMAPVWVSGEAVAARVRLRPRGEGAQGAGQGAPAAAHLTLLANHTAYTVHVHAHSGLLQLEWEWAGASDGAVELGAVPAGRRLRVGARLHNPAPRPLCVVPPRPQPPLHFELEECGEARCECVPAHAHRRAALVVSAPHAPGSLLQGTLRFSTEWGAWGAEVRGRVVAGDLRVRPVHIRNAAPWVWSAGGVVVESSLSARAHLLGLQPHNYSALQYIMPEEEESRWVGPGVAQVGQLQYRAERSPAPQYTGLDPHTTEGAAWWSRGGAAALQQDAALAERRHRLYRAARTHHLALRMRTSQVEVAAAVRWGWPRLLPEPPHCAPGDDMLLLLRNPASTPLYVEPLIAHRIPLNCSDCEVMSPLCASEECTWDVGAFTWTTARAPGGVVVGAGAALPLAVRAARRDDGLYAAMLYLRNNLTVLEGVQLGCRGARPALYIDNKPATPDNTILLQVGGCSALQAAREVTVRNAGGAALRLARWSVAGRPCAARGFSVAPCEPLLLAPNASARLTLRYTADGGVGRALAPLAAGGAAATLLARAPRCPAPPPPFDQLLRSPAHLLVMVGLVVVIIAGALDAERVLRVSRRARAAAPPPALDLRAPAAVPPPPRPRRRRLPRRAPPAADPAAERRAFARWHAAAVARADASSDASDAAPPPAAAPPRSTPSTPSTASTPTEPDDPGDHEDHDQHEDHDDHEDHEDHDGHEDHDDPGEQEEAEEPEEPEEQEGRRGETPPPDTVPSRKPRRDRSDTKRKSREAVVGAGDAGARPRPLRRAPAARRRPPPAWRAPGAAVPSACSDNNMGPIGSGSGVREGASWSSVVASRGACVGAPCVGAPCGVGAPCMGAQGVGGAVSARPATDHSLFYYGAAAPAPWSPAPAPAPAPDQHYLGSAETSAVGLGVVGGWEHAGWGSWWEEGAVRPPPGFPAPPAPRAYDPFRSLADIWAPPTLPAPAPAPAPHSAIGEWPPRRDDRE